MGDKEHHKVGKRAVIVGFFTFLSRIMGLIRDAVVAYFLGASATADAFYVAFRIPNLIRRFTAEGAMTIAFVPVFTEYLKQSKEEGKKVAGIVFTYLSLLLVLIVVFGVIFAPYIVKMIAYGFTEESAKFELTVYLTRLMFPYIFLISLTALAMGILNSMKHFTAPAASPILLNIAIIVGAAVFSKWFDEPTLGLALGVIIGGIAQLLLQVPVLIKKGMLPRINFDYTHPGLKKLLFLMLPAAFGAAVYQVNVLVITFLASFLPDGSVSYLWYADRVTEFPLGIFAIAIATAMLPSLSDHAADKDLEAFRETFRYGIRGALAIAIPSSIGLYILSHQIVRLLFQRGEFDALDTVGVAGTLCMFVIGLPFVSAVRNIVPAFFAMKDSKTPVMISTVVVACNAILAYLLMKTMSYRGLALAVATSNAINFVLLSIFLKRKIGVVGFGILAASAARVLLASAAMGAAVWWVRDNYLGFLIKGDFVRLLLGVFLLVLIGGAAYLLALAAIRAPELRMFTRIIKRKGE